LSGLIIGAGVGATASILMNKRREAIKQLSKDPQKLDNFHKTLYDFYEKIKLLRDNLKENVDNMLNYIKSEEDEFKTDYPHFPLELKLVKMAGLIDAHLLNRWSTLPKEKKYISISFLGSIDLSNLLENELNMEFIITVMERERCFSPSIIEAIRGFYKYFKIPVLEEKNLKDSYNDSDLKAMEFFLEDFIKSK
ncbi:YtxH domain-containing protein, partial [bacterium]|nr:YtxH domain-containing protein [bacterium]